MKQAELVLFGAKAPVASNIAEAVNVHERFVTLKQKGKDGKFHTVKDKDGNPVLAKDQNGDPILATVSINLHPRSSKDHTDLKDITGKTGQGLMLFEREARDLLCDSALAELQRLRATGAYTFAREVRNQRNGAITLTLKPVFGGKNLTTSSDEEIAKELERRGYSVERNPAHDNGESKPADKPAELPISDQPAPKSKGKKS